MAGEHWQNKGIFEVNGEERQDNGFLFVTALGSAVEVANYQRFFQETCKAAGIRKINFHALRHTFASRCLEAGFDIKSLSDILGHTDAKMTLNTYECVK